MSPRDKPTRPTGPAVLIGSKPVEGPATLTRLGVPFIWVVDPVDGPPPSSDGAIRILEVPFKSDPLSLLEQPLPDRICGALSFTEMGSLPAALLSEALDLPTVPTRAVVRAREKLVMRRLLADCGSLAFGVVGTDSPGPDDFPIVVKPPQGTGSQGVEYIVDADTYRIRAPELSGALWEHYVDGPEYSVESVSSNGIHRILGMTAKRTTGKPYFVETGHEVPAQVSAGQAEEIQKCVRNCLDALHINVGAAHTEVKVEDGRAVLIETHTRPGGDRIPLLTQLVSGLDQYELAVHAMLPWVKPVQTVPQYAYAAVHYFPWQGATFGGVEELEKCREMDGVIEIELRARSGEEIPVWRYSHERPGHVVVGASDRAELRRRIDRVADKLRPHLR